MVAGEVLWGEGVVLGGYRDGGKEEGLGQGEGKGVGGEGGGADWGTFGVLAESSAMGHEGGDEGGGGAWIWDFEEGGGWGLGVAGEELFEGVGRRTGGGMGWR